jgi:hypothetical protein
MEMTSIVLIMGIMKMKLCQGFDVVHDYGLINNDENVDFLTTAKIKERLPCTSEANRREEGTMSVSSRARLNLG